MHRQFSLQPFSRHYSHSTNPFLDFLELEDTTAPGPGSDTGITAGSSASVEPAITVHPTDLPRLRTVLSEAVWAAYKRTVELGEQLEARVDGTADDRSARR